MSAHRTLRLPSWPLLLIIVGPPLLLWAAIFVCRIQQIPLGQGSFVYRYSPFPELRLAIAFGALPGIALLFAAVVRGARPDDSSRLTPRAILLATLGVLCLAAWNVMAPPHFVRQHYLNFSSPSHDGAFIFETINTPSIPAYLRKFPAIQTQSIAALRGTRVLSNPPGMTVLTLFIRDSWPVGWIEDFLANVVGAHDAYTDLAALGLKLALVCSAFWALTVWPLYAAGRRCLPAAPALAVAAIAVFAPAAFDFSPGKDAAQMLIAALQLLGALLALSFPDPDPALEHHTARPLAGGALLGAATTLGLFFGLLLAWTALPPLVFVLWTLRNTRPGNTRLGNTRPDNSRPDLIRFLLAGLVGAVAMGLFLDFAVGYNVVTGSLAVARTFETVQPQIHVSRSIWLLIGLPITLLFTPAALPSALLLRRRISRPATHSAPHRATRRATRRAGPALLFATLLTLAATYLLGIPYELPRLWLAFLPALTLGCFLASPPFHARRPVIARLAAILMALSIFAAAAHWAQLDPREAEQRLAKPDPLL